MFYRNTYIEVNLDNFSHNVKTMQATSNKQVFCVCKANAYSHGDFPIAKKAHELGCPYICVSSLDEAMSLRKQGFDGNVLVLGFVAVKDVEIALEHNITISVISKEWAQELITTTINFEQLNVHIKIDTGMNRLGIKKLSEVQEVLHQLLDKKVNVEGIFTHFHSADDVDKSLCERQAKWFYSIVDQLKHTFKWVHTSNSDASLSFVDDKSNAIRVGLSLYGIKSVESEAELLPTLSLYTSIAQVKEVSKGETIGYGATYTCYKDMYIATLPIGYGDGFLRANQGRFMCVEDQPYEIVGRVCMDHCMIALDEPLPVGQIVEIIGPHTPLVKMAKELNMIPYEVLCLLNDRITKKIIEHDEVVAVIHSRLPE